MISQKLLSGKLGLVVEESDERIDRCWIAVRRLDEHCQQRFANVMHLLDGLHDSIPVEMTIEGPWLNSFELARKLRTGRRVYYDAAPETEWLSNIRYPIPLVFRFLWRRERNEGTCLVQSCVQLPCRKVRHLSHFYEQPPRVRIVLEAFFSRDFADALE